MSLAILADAPASSTCTTRPLRAERTRLAKPAFKGVELYSWRARDGFRYSLLWGTNRTKTNAEIKSETCALASVDAVKEVLGRLAPGEHVVWVNRGCPKNDCAYPPNDVVEALRRHARSVGIVLDLPDGRSRD